MISAGYKLPIPAWEGPLRKCCKCGVSDAPVFSGESTEKGEPIFNHKVILDMMYIDKRILTRREREDGWEMMDVAGDPVKIRTLCRECLEAIEETSSVWNDFRKQREREQSEEDGQGNFYYVLCS